MVYSYNLYASKGPAHCAEVVGDACCLPAATAGHRRRRLRGLGTKRRQARA